MSRQTLRVLSKQGQYRVTIILGKIYVSFFVSFNGIGLLTLIVVNIFSVLNLRRTGTTCSTFNQSGAVYLTVRSGTHKLYLISK